MLHHFICVWQPWKKIENMNVKFTNYLPYSMVFLCISSLNVKAYSWRTSTSFISLDTLRTQCWKTIWLFFTIKIQSFNLLMTITLCSRRKILWHISFYSAYLSSDLHCDLASKKAIHCLQEYHQLHPITHAVFKFARNCSNHNIRISNNVLTLLVTC